MAILAASCPMGARAQAQNQPPPPGVRSAEPPAQRQPNLFAILDTNHDGILDEQEIAQAPQVLRGLSQRSEPRPPNGLRAASKPRAIAPRPEPPGVSGMAANSIPDDHGRPVALVAADLGVTPEQFRAAFKKVRPAPRGERPTEAQRQANRIALAGALDVSPEKLDSVMDKYRPEGPGKEWGIKP